MEMKGGTCHESVASTLTVTRQTHQATLFIHTLMKLHYITIAPKTFLNGSLHRASWTILPRTLVTCFSHCGQDNFFFNLSLTLQPKHLFTRYYMPATAACGNQGKMRDSELGNRKDLRYITGAKRSYTGCCRNSRKP